MVLQKAENGWCIPPDRRGVLRMFSSAEMFSPGNEVSIRIFSTTEKFPPQIECFSGTKVTFQAGNGVFFRSKCASSEALRVK